MTSHGQPDQSRSARYILKDYVSVSARPESGLKNLVLVYFVAGFAYLCIVGKGEKGTENHPLSTKMCRQSLLKSTGNNTLIKCLNNINYFNLPIDTNLLSSPAASPTVIVNALCFCFVLKDVRELWPFSCIMKWLFVKLCTSSP